MFPFISEEDLRALCRALCYHPDGGGGFTFTHADFLRMSLGDVFSHVEWLDDQRAAERRAVEKAAKKR